MFECKYKLELADCLISAKYVYKSQRRKREKVFTFLLPIMLIVTIAMLVVDIVFKKSIVWDIVLVVAVVILQILFLMIPVTLNHSQKKSFKAQKLDEMDYLLIKIENNLCVETLYKDEKEMAKNVHNLRALTSYLEDNDRLVLVFNKVEFVCIRKEHLTGGVEKLREYLNKALAKTSKK